MKTLLLVNQFPPFLTSAARLYSDLAEDLTTQGHRVTVVTHEPPEARPPFEDPPGVRVIRLKAPPIPRHVPALRALEQFWTAAHYLAAASRLDPQDVILVYSPPLPLGLAALPLARAWRGKWVLNAQDLYPKTAVDLGLLRSRFAIRLAEALEAFEYRFADAVVVHSEGNRRYVIDKGVPAGRAHSIFNWVDLQSFHGLHADRTALAGAGIDGGFVVFYGGAMGFAQAIDEIIAAAEILKDDPDVVFLLVGDGIARKPMQERAESLGLTRVRFLPKVPLPTYNALVAESDVAIVTLRRELCSPVVPGKLQSIMAAGRPVIVSTHPVSDAKTIVEDARCGMFVDANQPQAMANAIVHMKNHPEELRAMGERARAFAERHFDRTSCIAAYERLLCDLLNRKEQPDDGLQGDLS